MKRLRFKKPHNIRVLQEEIIAQVPDLSPVQDDNGFNVAVFTISGDGNNVEIDIDDDVDERSIELVINAHGNPPEPERPSPSFGSDTIDVTDRRIERAVTELRGYVATNNPTNQETAEIIKLLCKISLTLLKRSL